MSPAPCHARRPLIPGLVLALIPEQSGDPDEGPVETAPCDVSKETGESPWEESVSLHEQAIRLENSLSDEDDRDRSLPLLRQAAEEGDPNAQWHLGLRYLEGWRAPHLPQEGLRLCRAFAENGCVWAQRELGDALLGCVGWPGHALKAAYWYWRAARQGDREAMYRIGTLYADGIGVRRCDGEALVWLILATTYCRPGRVSAQVDPAWIQLRDEVGRRLDPGLRILLEGRARAWRHQREM